jgi:hypothetical protein
MIFISALCTTIYRAGRKVSSSPLWRNFYVITSVVDEARSWLRYCDTSRKVAGSRPNGVICIFHLPKPSGRAMTLGSTKPLTEMSTSCLSGGLKATDWVDKLATIMCWLSINSGSLNLLFTPIQELLYLYLLWMLLKHYKGHVQFSYPYKPFFQIHIILELLGDGTVKFVIVTNCYVCDVIVKRDYVYCYGYFDQLLSLLLLLIMMMMH